MFFDKLIKNVKGSMSASLTQVLMSILIGFVLIVAIFVSIAALAPTFTSASASLCSSGLPLSGVLGGSGSIVALVLMIGILVAIVVVVFKKLIPKQ